MLDNLDFRGFESVRLTAADGASAVISLFGAQVLSWVPAGGREQLFLSSRATNDGVSPVRGGIPVIFPQFSTLGNGPRHGFARTRRWQLLDHREEHGAFACASLQLASDAATRPLWNSDFLVELTVMIEANRLDLELAVTVPESTGTTVAIPFTAALHTYLRVGNIELTRLEGLEGREFLENGDTTKRQRDNRHALLFDGAVDRVYLDYQQPVLLSEQGRHVVVTQAGFSETVIWNPWENNGLSDLEPLDFKRMLCVEAALVDRPVALEAGGEWVGRQTLIAGTS